MMNETSAQILASVNGMPVTAADVDAFIASMGQRAQQYANPEGRKIILQQLIDQKLFLSDARRNLYEADPAFKAQLERVKEDLLTNFAVSKALGDISVTDDELKKYYDENSDRFQSGETVNADHILVDTEEKALEIKGKIDAGDLSFADAAKQFSSCPSSQNGGNLGDFGRGQMVPEFDEACFSMEEGQVSGPVKTQFGYHLIRVNKKSDASTMPFEQVKDELRGALLREKQQKAYESKVNQLKILYPVDMY